MNLSQHKTVPWTVPSDTTFFHVTHWKAGSQWIRAILAEAYDGSLIGPAEFEDQVLEQPIQLGKAYTCTYVARNEFQALALPGKHRRFVVIRDLRDTLVSGYFSLRYSHGVGNLWIKKWRRVMNSMNDEEGMLYLLEVWLNNSAIIQRTWVESGEPVIHFENFMEAPVPTWERALQHWGVTAPKDRLEALVQKYSFSNLSGGRTPGQSNQNAHYRKGVSGDWREHFTPKIIKLFKQRYGEILVAAGYERSDAW